MENKIKLDLIGITYNQIESGVYAVVLQESGGCLRLPIIIGTAEAQSIECKLQNVITPRPLTHDWSLPNDHTYVESLYSNKPSQFFETMLVWWTTLHV